MIVTKNTAQTAMLAIVSIVAIVGIIILIVHAKASTSYDTSSLIQEATDSAGQATGYGTNSCIDSDNGKNYSVAGIVTATSSGKTTKYYDKCVSTTSKTLIEYYCIGTQVNSTPYSCATSCKNGACTNTIVKNDSSTKIPLYTIFEATFYHMGTINNAYVDLEANAQITTPTGKKLTVPLFWDGDNIWKFRFSPTQKGTYSYVVISKNSGLNGKMGTFVAIDSSSKGFLIRDPNNNFAFKYSNGERAFMMGDTFWNGMSMAGGVTNTVFKQYIDIRAKQKFTYLRTYIVPFYYMDITPLTAPQHANEGGVAFTEWNPDKINPKYFREIDNRIAYANSKGLMVHLLIGGDDDTLVKFFGWDNGKMERYVKYVAARYDAYNINWEGRAEIEDQKERHPGIITLGNTLGNWIEKYGVHNHLQSIHTLDSTAFDVYKKNGVEFANEKWLDWNMHQGYSNSPDSKYQWDWIVRDRQFNKPVMNEESYYEHIILTTPTHKHHVDTDTMRKGIWQVMMHGASGLSYGNTATYSARKSPFQGLKYANSLGAQQMTYLFDFFQTTAYWDLEPSNTHCSSGYCLVNEGKEYVIYSENGTIINVTLASGTYNAKFYNPRTGKYDSTVIVQGSDTVPLIKPDSEDWVLHIKKR